MRCAIYVVTDESRLGQTVLPDGLATPAPARPWPPLDGRPGLPRRGRRHAAKCASALSDREQHLLLVAFMGQAGMPEQLPAQLAAVRPCPVWCRIYAPKVPRSRPDFEGERGPARARASRASGAERVARAPRRCARAPARRPAAARCARGSAARRARPPASRPAPRRRAAARPTRRPCWHWSGRAPGPLTP